MSNIELNTSQEWNSHSVQPEKECRWLLIAIKNHISLLKEPQKWSYPLVTNGTIWIKTKFKTLMNM